MKFLNVLTLVLSVMLIASCQQEAKQSVANTEETSLTTGKWRAEIALNDGSHKMPFNFEVIGNGHDQKIFILNGEERLLLNELNFNGDSVTIPMHIFDAEIVAKVEEGKLTGNYRKPGIYSLPFHAELGNDRFTDNLEVPVADVSGKWAVDFQKPDGNSTFAVGVFEQKGNQLTGTFMTQYGDYRFLEGIVTGKELKLSTFDGAHMYLFEATIDGDQITQGDFWSGKTGHRTWTAKRDENVALPDASSLTHLKEGFETIDFTFPNIEGKEVSISDERYKGKVVVVQILGSWCPNCMDETAFMAPFYQKYKDKGLEVIGLAYENTDKLEVAAKKMKRMKDRFDIGYELLYAGQPKQAEASLPMLEKIVSFPTSILIDRNGKVVNIHTGFNGPGTGEYYDQFVEEFTAKVEHYLAEAQ
ncbi:TlpA disulfide reductase family protein [Limibacter armeniacum]|uniref:peroxiredoxin family protein n=1 Tax=Limibacter armeniacum TaxID=466084 RepID=UPI002FE5EC20